MAGVVAMYAMYVLLYLDQGYKVPGIWEVAAVLVEEETHRYQSTKNCMSYLTAWIILLLKLT